MIRRAETDADLAGWCEVWNAERLYLLAEDVGAG
jgi:hypothetical protein